MEKKELPKDIRTILLAYPRRITKKYKPPVYIPGTVDSGVSRSALRAIRAELAEPEPVENWRINQLAKPRVQKEKWVFVPEVGVGTGIPPSALTIETPERSNDLSKPYVSKLISTREMYKHKGEKFVNTINKLIDQSWQTVYYFYRRQLLKRKKKKRKKYPKGVKRKDSKGKLLSDKEIMERRKKEVFERCIILAKPKKRFLPRPLKKKKIANLELIGPRMVILAEPKYPTKKYIRPSIDPNYVEPLRVSEAAKKCVPTARTKELARSPAHRVLKVKEKIPGVVARGALNATPTERQLVLAEPKKKANVIDNDLKENPFMISPNALKATASARTRELAKPIER